MEGSILAEVFDLTLPLDQVLAEGYRAMDERRAIKTLLRPWREEFVQMAAWPKEELQMIAKADDLHIAPFRNDGKTYGTPTWIWSVAVGDALYVRAYNGIKSRWYQAALKQKAGRIIAAGMTKEVSFEPVNGAINERIDEAYRAKYREAHT